MGDLTLSACFKLPRTTLKSLITLGEQPQHCDQINSQLTKSLNLIGRNYGDSCR